MVREQKLTLRQQRKGCDIQMIGVAVREPVVLRIPDSLDLTRCNLIVVCPTAEIGVRVDPGIRREYRLIVVGNHDGIASSLEEPHYSPPFPTVAKLYSFTVWSYDPKAYKNYNAAVACRPQRRSDAKPAQNTDKILRSALLSVQTNFTLAEVGQLPARNQRTCEPDP